MDERKTYLKTDELQADDEPSPLPSVGGQGGHQLRQREEAQPQGSGEDARATAGDDVKIGGEP
jgi:hypothetical protein